MNYSETIQEFDKLLKEAANPETDPDRAYLLVSIAHLYFDHMNGNRPPS